MEPTCLMLRNELPELKRLGEWVQTWTHADAPHVSHAVQLCLEEAVSNIVMYGADIGNSLDISVELERNGEALVARIEDNGRPFDPTRASPPTLAASLEEAKVGNLGIALMRSFATEMKYERRLGRNRLTLRFRDQHFSAA